VTRKRVGLYGGSFNPVHNGHLRTALEVRAALDLHEVWLIPAQIPPHKDPADVVDAQARLAMLELAIDGVTGLRAEPIELEREGPSYTIDTIHLLKDRHPTHDLTLILGFDTFREIHSWYRYESLLAECDVVVTSRPPQSVYQGENRTLFEQLPIAVASMFCYSESVGCYLHQSGRRLEFVPVTLLDISSSALRNEVAAGRPVHFLVPQAVWSFIAAHELYAGAPRR
jgi:nicotinate-nucleotide adenylyltransferase